MAHVRSVSDACELLVHAAEQWRNRPRRPLLAPNKWLPVRNTSYNDSTRYRMQGQRESQGWKDNRIKGH